MESNAKPKVDVILRTQYKHQLLLRALTSNTNLQYVGKYCVKLIKTSLDFEQDDAESN